MAAAMPDSKMIVTRELGAAYAVATTGEKLGTSGNGLNVKFAAGVTTLHLGGKRSHLRLVR